MIKQVRMVGCMVALGCLPVLAGETRSTMRALPEPSPERSVAAQHCVAVTEPDGVVTTERDGVVVEGLKVVSIECHSTFSEAIFAATRGAVRLPEGEDMATALDRLDVELRSLELQGMESRLLERPQESDPQSVLSAELQHGNPVVAGLYDGDLFPLPASASYVHAVDYQNANFGGYSLTWTNAYPCTSTRSFYAASMPSGWNDRVSSTRGYSNCNVNKLYEHTNFGGSVKTCYPSCSYVGDAMNDRTSSRKWLY